MSRKSRRLWLTSVIGAVAAATVVAQSQDFDDALKREAAEYTAKLRLAGEDLNRTRERIAREKAPLLSEMRSLEDRVIALETETSRLASGQENHAGEKRRLLHEIDELHRNNTYLASLASDGLRVLEDGLAPGEDAGVGERLGELQRKIDAATRAGAGPESVEAADFILGRTRRVLGGAVRQGSAMNANNNRVLEGTFAFTGPEVFFKPAGGEPAGSVRLREGSRQPVFYPLAQWREDEATAFFSGGNGVMIADASGGKALRLEQASGSVIDHINKGGKVAYVIVLVGFVALLLVVQKTFEVFRFGSDSPQRVAGILHAVASGSRAEAQSKLAGLRRVTRELFEEGLRNIDMSRTILEERLESLMLANRLQLERRLPMLAVIATAAPLLGLLGTVVGMVRTFSLITVFGTGNAGRLSGGISEVLVATELGLAVAIPTLVVHGFLSSRAHKDLALLERHALDFVTAVEISRTNGSRAADRAETIR